MLVIFLGGEAVGEAPICPAGRVGEGGPPVRGDAGRRCRWEEGDEFDVAAVGKEDERVCIGVST